MKIKKRILSIGSNLKSHTERFLSSILQSPEIKQHKRFIHPLKGLLQHIGSLQFIERLFGFLVFFLIEVLFIKIFVDFGLPTIDLALALHIPQRTPLFILITSLTFLMIARYRLFQLKRIKPFDFKRFLVLFAANIAFFIFFFKLNIFMIQNPELVLTNSLLFLSAWYGSAFALTVALFLAFFEKNYLSNFIKKFIKPFCVSSIISLIFLYTYPLLEKFWLILSTITAGTSYKLLNIFYPTKLSIISGKAPAIALPGFKATIAAECSGIEGITLFIFLFTLLLLLDWKFINKKKVVFLYLIGISGTIALNILRITALFLIGQIHSPELAVGFFHSNAGWILFSAYFVIFEFLTYGWLRKKNENKN